MKKKLIFVTCFASLVLLCATACSSGTGSTPTDTVESSSVADISVNDTERKNDNSESNQENPAASESEQIEEKQPTESKKETTASQSEATPEEKDKSGASEKEKLSSSATEQPAPKTTAISTKKVEFSFGVASNGKPHSQSTTNQQLFDGMNGVDALALDTKSTDKRMYLTFDCGYEYQNLTADILDTLKEKNVKAAFFCTLSYLKKNPELVQRMIDEGHIVGNHSATHPVFPDISHDEMTTEVVNVDQYLHYNFNYASDYFRYPTGAYSEDSLNHLTSIGKKSIFWSVAYNDWDTANQNGADYAFETVTARYHPGAVILLHAVSQDNADALGKMIDDAHNNGYVFKSLDDYKF